MVDQPDAVYLTATISTDYDYVIEGTRTDQVYFSCESRASFGCPVGLVRERTKLYQPPWPLGADTVYEHESGGGWAERVVSETAYPHSSLSGLEIRPDASGRYRILVSRTEPPTLQPHEQWLRLPPSAGPGEVSIIARHYFEGETSVQMYDGRAKSDVVAEISVVEDSSSTRSKYPPIPSDENVAQRIDFLSNFLVDHTIVNAPGGRRSQAPVSPNASSSG